LTTPSTATTAWTSSRRSPKGEIAKIVLASMVGFAFLAILSLLWMRYRVHRRAGFGPKAGATLRSAHALVLGFGGWFLGALIVLSTLPAVPVDNQLLVVLSVGTPVGLGVYLAWVNRNWAAQAKAAGAWTAVGGAAIGTWLGSNAIDGLYAVLTAIVCAVATANLALLILDIWWAGGRTRDVHLPCPQLRSLSESGPLGEMRSTRWRHTEADTTRPPAIPS
jgi:hypothetical protein